MGSLFPLTSPPFLFPSFLLLSPPFPSSPLLSLPLPLEVGLLLRLGGLGPSWSTQAPQRVLVNCRLKIAPVAMVLRRFMQEIPVHDRSQKTQHVTLYVNHNIPSIVQWDPKVLVLLWLERRPLARSERHAPKAIHQWCFRGIFPGCRSSSKTKIF